MTHRTLLATLLGLLLGAGSGAAALTPGDYSNTLPFGGLTRTYDLHVPPGYTGAEPVPLVLNFHGLDSNSIQQAGISRMGAVSNREGFILVHPNGFDNSWNAGICCGSTDTDDVGFVRALVAELQTMLNIDARRIYATGLSNGGAISQRLACEAADLFAAAAPMAFPLSLSPMSTCRPVRSIPVLTVMGLTDVLVEYENGFFPSAPDTFAYWHDVNGCTGTTPDETVTQGQSRCETYTDCAGGVQVGLCSVVAQEFPPPFEDISGHVLYLNDDFELAEVAWAFFAQFTLPEDVATPEGVALRGTSTLRFGSRPQTRAKDELSWTLALGDGTWTATDADGTVFTGSARPLGRKGRTQALTLTGASREELRKIIDERLVALTNSTGLATNLGFGNELRLKTDKAGRPTKLSGKLSLLRGGVASAVIGSYAVRARR